MNCAFCHLPVPARRRPEPDNAPAYCCYGCRFAAEITRAHGEAGQANWMLARLGVAVFLSMSVMMFSMFGYRQELAATEGASPTDVSVQLGGLMQYLSLLFAAPVFLLLGLPIFSHAVEQNDRRAAATDVLIILGVAAAFMFSCYATFTGRGQSYFDTACGILVFVTLGRWLEARGKLRAADAILSLQRLLPDEIAVEREGRTLQVAPFDVRAGDLVRIRPGERIAADGRIESGSAAVDEQIVTGESAPIEKRPGDFVRAGTLSLDGAICIRAASAGSAGTLSRLAALLEDARNSRGRYQRLADRAAAVFLPLTMAAAILAGVLGFQRGGWNDAVLSPLSVLLIACPCALGIATPAAIWVALGVAASRRILIRDAETLERLAHIRAVCFDKTGTLTTAHPRVVEWVAFDGDSSEILQAAAAVAAHSSHTLARAVLEFTDASPASAAEIDDARTIPGRGVLARWRGEDVVIGSLAMMVDAGLVRSAAVQACLDRLAAQGRSIMLVGLRGHVAGVFAFDESLRDDSAHALAALRRAGLAVCVLSGDHETRGRRLSEALDVPVFAGLLPEHKVDHVRDLQRRRGAVAVVGDGLNDAPALAAADVGIAMGCGADIARECAGVCLAGNDLAALPWLLSIAKRTVRTIRVNLFWAFAYNAVGIALAVTGRLSPLFAAGAMVASSLFVVANSLRLSADRPPQDSTTQPDAALRAKPVAHGAAA